jgi:hypothetical protein
VVHQRNAKWMERLRFAKVKKNCQMKNEKNRIIINQLLSQVNNIRFFYFTMVFTVEKKMFRK